MGDWPSCDPGINESGGAVTASSRGTNLTANATINTENASFTEIVASCPFDADGFYLNVVPADTGASACGFLLDIAIGAASSEVEIISDLHIYRALDTDGTCDGFNAYIPYPIAAGTRISGRVRSNVTVTVCRVIVQFFKGNFLYPPGVGKIVVLGGVTADSGGTAIDPGTNSLVFVEFDSALDFDARYLYLTFGRQNDASGGIVNWLIRVARGASGNEARNVVVDYLHARQGAGSDTILPSYFGPIPVNLKAGDRLAVGVQADSATNDLLDCTVMLVG